MVSPAVLCNASSSTVRRRCGLVVNQNKKMDWRSHETIQEKCDRLTHYTDERREVLKLERARPIFTRPVFKTVGCEIKFDLDPPENVRSCRRVLSKWADGRSFSLWISERLPVHLDLPVRMYPEDCSIWQALVLGERLPPVFLVLYTQDSTASEGRLEEMKEFCTKCTKILTLSLLNFCHREFLLLPCTMRYDADFSAKALKKEVEHHLGEAREFYGGPEELGKATYEELVRAVSLSATATTVPCYLCDGQDQNKEWLVTMDDAWVRTMGHVIDQLLGDTQVTVTYSPKTEIKTKSAILEAAKRISYFQRVVVITSNDRVNKTVQLLSETAREENGHDPDFFSSASPGESTSQADCVIAVDADDVTTRQTENLKMMVLKRPTTLNEKERVRVLLIGRSGSGKSATANTLLGEELFESSVSFSAVTTASDTRQRTYKGREIEVVDSPGVRDVTKDKGVDINYLTREADSGQGFDVICYVMRIGRFTEEEDKVFRRLISVLGPSVLRRMILIFTCGDRIPQSDNIASILAQAPERLKKILEECQQRYVVFDNIAPQDRSQIDAFFEMVRRMEDSQEPFYCPSAADMEENWQRSCAEDKQRRWTELGLTAREEHRR